MLAITVQRKKTCSRASKSFNKFQIFSEKHHTHENVHIKSTFNCQLHDPIRSLDVGKLKKYTNAREVLIASDIDKRRPAIKCCRGKDMLSKF